MNHLRQLAENEKIRRVVAAGVIILTLVAFIYYLATNPETLASLLGLKPATLLLLTTAYTLTVTANAFVLWASLKLINKNVKYSENVALTGYSSIVNFFGPLQSGPGFRAAYLKTKHSVSIKRFFYVTVIFYGFFAALNGAVIGIAVVDLLQPALILPVILALIAVSALVFWFANKQPKIKESLRSIRLTDIYFWAIGLGALLLSLATALAYYIELRHVDASVTIAQTIVYTAAANLALFVSLTPGAIGFRESFLFLSQQLHQIPMDTVVAASIIDRAFYVIFLLGMFLVLILVGARTKLQKAL